MKNESQEDDLGLVKALTKRASDFMPHCISTTSSEPTSQIWVAQSHPHEMSMAVESE